jgi:hypothetical protein
LMLALVLASLTHSFCGNHAAAQTEAAEIIARRTKKAVCFGRR